LFIVKIVRPDGRPFLLLDSDGIREIVSPMYEALSMGRIKSGNVMHCVKLNDQFIYYSIPRLMKVKLLPIKSSLPQDKTKPFIYLF